MKKKTDHAKNEVVCVLATNPSKMPPVEISAALKVLSGKWTLMILCLLSKKIFRFNELKRMIPGITQHMLTASLRELEANGLVQRKIFAEVPPRVEYSMTAHGKSLRPVIESLANWGRLHIEKQAILNKKIKAKTK